MAHARDIRRGVEAGLVAAVASSLPGLAWVVASDEPPWRAVQLIATLVGIDQVGRFDAAAFVVGGVLHLAISIAFALAFALLVPPLDVARSASVGAAYGLAIYLVDFELTQVLGIAAALRAGTNDVVELFAHVLYGASMASWLAWRRQGFVTAV